MRLTSLLSVYKMYKRPIGFKYRGKNRALRRITLTHMLEMKENLEREEENMMWLRHPYLTIEQDKGHMVEFKINKYQDVFFEGMKLKTRKFVKPVLITDRLKCLMVTDAWE